jgi:hypothetical protein
MSELKTVPVANKVIIEHIARRINRNANAFVLVVGDVGSGKSYFAMDFGLALAERFDCKFDMSWAGFTASKILDVVLREHKKGQPILLDEMGVAMSSRKFMTRENVGLSFVLQTVRFMNHCLLFTVPQLSFVDVHARRLFHYVAICKPKFRGNRNFISFRMVVENKKNPERPYLRPIPYKAPDGAIKYAGTYTTAKPPQWFTDSYEKERKDYIVNMYNEQKSMMQGMKEGKLPNEKREKKKPCPLCSNVIDIDANFCVFCGGTLT